MLQSDNFKETVITINGNKYRMEYDVATTINDNSLRGFGNIYIDADKDPVQFTFTTLNGRIAGYTPMNGTKEFISNLVSTVVGKELPFE